MRLKDSKSVFNMGDTSFRRKTLLDDYKVLLPLLIQHKEENPQWERNNEAQAIFYKTVLKETDLFERSSSDEPAKRGRTLTNSLIKPGLINDKREVGEAGRNWIEGKSKPADEVESWMSLSMDNIVFLRQLMKLRVYSSETEHYFYPFRVALEFLSVYSDVPEKDFLFLIHSINPEWTDEKIRQIISSYEDVVESHMIFDEFVDKFFSSDEHEYDDEAKKARTIFSQSEVNYEEFAEVFRSGKSSDSVKKYFEFYEAVKRYKSEATLTNLESMLQIAKDPKIKKAFGYNAKPFKEPRTVEYDVTTFEEMNFGNPLLDDDDMKFYFQFVNSKRADLIKEYSDMTKRTFNLSGIFTFDNGLINLTQPWLISELTTTYRSKNYLTGVGAYEDYESNICSDFYSDLSFIEITELAKSEIENIAQKISKQYGISDVAALSKFFEDEKEKRFRDMVDKEFTRERTVELLKLFSDRTPQNDKKIQRIVSDSATVPTIFEYVLAIAWYHVADGTFSLRKSLNLSLDGNFKPLTHAAGGDGDIVMEFADMTLMLEATLMGRNSQKRGELEPVIRHTANLAIRSDNSVMTIFVADQLDTNVTNIFKATTHIELESTQQKGITTKGIRIFAMTIGEVIEIIDKKIPHQKIVDEISVYYSLPIAPVTSGWRETLMTRILQ
ncbi:AlwI family type II restriction endonuclease [Bacillus cytotoxicus]|uniref:AlwI family type II restriction endonuclease n=1 Tax=Bacillus cytotoxicus TaxID=580165 RepID=UPI003D7E3E96